MDTKTEDFGNTASDRMLEARVVSQPRFICPDHGDQGNFVGIQISVTPHEGMGRGLTKYVGARRYCMACYIEFLDANLEQLQEVPALKAA